MTLILDATEKMSKQETELFIKNNIYKLAHENGLVREKARKLLESLGTPVIDYLIKYINHPKKQARWEAVKALSEINDPVAAPVLVNALEDNSFDVRWIAAEGLARMGESGLQAVFETLILDPDSVFLRKGAHHILTRLAEEYDEPEIKKLRQLLDVPDAKLKIILEGKPHLNKIIEKINTINHERNI